jgi:hypothetical protein
MTDNHSDPWRVLILDRDPADRKYIVATVAIAADVRPARPSSPHGDLDEITAWMRTHYGLGPSITLLPLVRPLAWTITQRRGQA